MRYLCASLAILFALTSPPRMANAEPTRSISYLMNEPMTLFDWGLHQVSTDLDGLPLEKNGPKVLVTSSYDWNKNRIDIRAMLRDKRCRRD